MSNKKKIILDSKGNTETGVSIEEALVEPTRVKVGTTKEEESISQRIATEKRIAETVKLLDENTNYKNVPKEISNVLMNGPKVMVRLFQHIPYKPLSTTNMRTPLLIDMPSPNGGTQKVTRENPFQIVPCGILVNISDTCSEKFREYFKVGDVVNLVEGAPLYNSMYTDKIPYAMSGMADENTFENYFIFNEGVVAAGYKVDPDFYAYDKWLTAEDLEILSELKLEKNG